MFSILATTVISSLRHLPFAHLAWHYYIYRGLYWNRFLQLPSRYLLVLEKVPSDVRRFVSTEKVPTRAFSWLKAATTAFTFKTLLRHYAKRALPPRSLNMKLGPRRNYHKGRANLSTRPAHQHSVLNVKAVVAAFNQEKALVGVFSVITKLLMKLFQAQILLTRLGSLLRMFRHLQRCVHLVLLPQVVHGCHWHSLVTASGYNSSSQPKWWFNSATIL